MTAIRIGIMAHAATAAALALTGSPLPDLPEAVTNNAVAALAIADASYIVSFSGLGPGKTHADTHARTFVYSGRTGAWSEAEPVPGDTGRLASVAATAGDRIYVFGGYTVAADGAEVSTPWVHAFDPVTGTYEALAPMPVPVDDAVAAVYGDRWIYLVSGWHDLGNVNLVQRYDTEMDRWDQATPTPGPAVFGHAGGIVDDRIVYCDGVAVRARKGERRDFAAVGDCLLGIIDPADPRRIDWRTLPPHPGPPRYRAAAAGTEAGVLFLGGSVNPYNYDGVGYDGEPSEPEPGGVFYSLEDGAWQRITIEGEPTMDHRGLVRFGDRWVTVGGMTEGGEVTSRVISYSVDPG